MLNRVRIVVLVLWFVICSLNLGILPSLAAGSSGDIVNFNDPSLETAVLEALGKSASPLSVGDLAGLTSLTAEQGTISDLTGLEYAVNLESLYLAGNQISNFSALASLTGLQELELSFNQIEDLSPLANLTGLQTLYLAGNQISDLSALVNLTGLQVLSLGENMITEVTALQGLSNLEEVLLWNNQIRDITPLVLNSQNNGLGSEAFIDLFYNYLDLRPGSLALAQIEALQSRGVDVEYSTQSPVPQPAPGAEAPQIWEAQTIQDPFKVWTIRFNLPVDTTTLTKLNVIVTDECGYPVSITREPGLDQQSVVVKPLRSGFTPGQTFTLNLSKEIKSTGGKSLQQPVQMQFAVN